MTSKIHQLTRTNGVSEMLEALFSASGGVTKLESGRLLFKIWLDLRKPMIFTQIIHTECKISAIAWISKTDI